MKIGILQLNYTIGDFKGNMQKILQGYHQAVKSGAELVVTSELSLFGYPPGDMLLRNDYIKAQYRNFEALCKDIGEIGLIVGLASSTQNSVGRHLYNSAALIQNGNIVHLQHKSLLPNYDVFDERRYFEPNTEQLQTFTYQGLNLGILICEDIWSDYETVGSARLYHHNPLEGFKGQPIDALITINASPFYMGKSAIRYGIAKSIATDLKCPLVYVNQIGGNDELIFDGQSFAVNELGKVIASAKGFEEEILVFDLKEANTIKTANSDDIECLHDALILGTRDYVLKSTRKSKVFIALSGGIDSAVTAYIACKALGPDNVHGFGMPSAFSSESSVEDARSLAKNLGISFQVIPIHDVYDIIGRTLESVIDWNLPGQIENDVTEENVQARIRGTIMMAISNRKGGIVLSTGNKSELSVGYCTLFGDMAGGFAVLSDVTKTNAYALSHYINRKVEIIPWNTINKAPSAELRPDQKDQDSLPSYDILDPILDAYIEKEMDERQIIDMGYSEQTIIWVVNKVNLNEYKRRQMAPGLKVTQKAFGVGRRMPIAARF